MCAATLPTPPRPSRTPPQWCSTSQRYTRRGADKRFSDLKVTLSKSRPQCPFCAHARSHMHVWLHASFLLRNFLWRTGDNVSTREAPRERLQLTGSGRRDIMWTLIRQCRAPPNRLLHHGHWELHLACVALRVMPVPLQIASRSRSGEQPCLQSMDEVIECLPVVRPYLQRLRHGFLKSA